MVRTRGACLILSFADHRNGVIVRAMGAAIGKAVCLAVELQKQGYSLGILTGTTEVVDDVTPDDNVLSNMTCAEFIGNGIGESNETPIDD
jgi:Rpp20 subunit of nuclear RNase MRP and P